jgi:hypothetical protein
MVDAVLFSHHKDEWSTPPDLLDSLRLEFGDMYDPCPITWKQGDPDGLAVEWAQFGINVNAIGPGFIKTDLTQPLWTNAEFDGWVKQRTPMGRWGTPADLGNVAVFLASEASAFVTGQVLYADGGLLAAL